MKGRKPQPTALKVLKGTFDKNPQRRNREEPTPPVSRPTCPRHLTRTAKAEWKRMVKELELLGVLTKVERGSLEQYCQTYSEWRHAHKTIEEDGRYYQGQNGMIEHPAGRAMRAHAAMLAKYLIEFGMTPSSRTRLHVNEKAPPTRMRRDRDAASG